jgi:hypothetical protein
MPRGSKKKQTTKQRRQAPRIEESGMRRGVSSSRAAQMAYATVNKENGGKKLGRGKKRSKSSAVQRRGRKGSRYAKR